MKILIMRHAKTCQNNSFKVQGFDDNDIDIKYRDELLKPYLYLKNNNINIDIFISSPLKRAVDSLVFIKQKLNNNLPIFINSDFTERDFGILTGLDVSYFYSLEKYPDMYENDTKLQNRLSNAIYKLYEKYRDKTIFISAHSHVIKSLLILADSKNYTYKTRFENCQIAILNVCKNIKLEKII